MGQGQADIAMQLLRECSQNGEWLCLKNLHLVTAWLPQLEKVRINIKEKEHTLIKERFFSNIFFFFCDSLRS